MQRLYPLRSALTLTLNLQTVHRASEIGTGRAERTWIMLHGWHEEAEDMQGRDGRDNARHARRNQLSGVD